MSAWPILGALLVFLPLWRIATLGAQPATPLFWGILGVMGTWIAGYDLRLGIFALSVAIRGFLTQAPLSFETAFAVIAGLLLLTTAQRTRMSIRPWIVSIAVASGVMQIALSLLQWYALPPVRAWVSGSIGNPAYLGSYLSISGALAPVWLLPLFIGGVVLTRSVGGALALAVALAVRYRKERGWMALGVVTLLGATAWLRSMNPSGISASLWKRVFVWRLGLGDLVQSPLAVLIGFGPGAWLRRFPVVQEQAKFALSEIHGQAHNEFVQLVYEGGLLALVLVALWLWSRRKVLVRSPVLPAVVAAGVSSLTMFPFQVAATAVLALTALGFATQETVR